MIRRVFISANIFSALISPRTTDCPINTSGSPDPSWWFSNSSHVSQLLRKDWADWRKQLCENSFNYRILCSEVYWQFSMSFAFQLSSGQWSRWTENRMSAFGEFQQHYVRNVIPSSLWTILFTRRPLLFRTWTNKWSLSNTKFLRKYFDDSGICQTFFFTAFPVTRDVLEHWHEENSSC